MKKSAATIVAEKNLSSIDKNLSAKRLRRRKHKHIVVRSKIEKK